MIVTALRQTFDSGYPESNFRNIKVGIEYPVDVQQYPSVYIDYDDDEPLQRAGIDHHEVLDLGINVPLGEGSLLPFTRWRFQGTVSFTVVALSSLERDRLYDEIIRILSFGDENTETKRFRDYVEDNEFIAANMNFDTLQSRGNAAAPGTPWGTDEIIYERSINTDILGEFVSDRITGALLPLSALKVYIENLADTTDVLSPTAGITYGTDRVTIVDGPPDLGATGWH